MSKVVFYRSAAWRRLSRAFLLSRNYICERCGQPAEIAHHRQYLTPRNMNNPDISLNPDNLEALCMACHNTEHFGTGGVVAQGLTFDETAICRRNGGTYESGITTMNETRRWTCCETK